MELNELLSELKKDAEQQIRRIVATEKDEIKQAYSCAQILHGINARLKTFIIGYEFSDRQEEINFFKHEKPVFLSEHIYQCEVYNIALNRPVGGKESQRDYLHRELEKLQDCIERHHEFYSYYRLGMSDNDEYYFTRANFKIGRQRLEPIMSEREPRYSSTCDYLLSLLQANERLEILLKSQLDELDIPAEETPKLSWKVKKIILIELLYALDSFRAFGRIPLKYVVKVFEKLLGIDLGNYTSEFSKMKDRDDPTPGLNALKSALLHRMKRTEHETT